MSTSLLNQVEAAATLIQQSTYMVVFTGAGISTPSGIPDFRSAESGLWQKDDPMQVASATAFREHPERFYNWLRPLLEASWKALPNPAHQAIAQLEEKGFVKAILTQNIDRLHQKAGSRKVIELHGATSQFHCPMCRSVPQDSQLIIEEILGGSIPHCSRCGGILKPDITLYEEALPEKAWVAACQETSQADLFLIAGSSLDVVPAASLPYQAYQHSSRLIVINYSATYLDRYADVVIHQNVAEVLPLITEKVSNRK